MKIITVCGSYKYNKEIKEVAEKLALEGNCVITPIDKLVQRMNILKKSFYNLEKCIKKKLRFLMLYM